MAGAPKFYVYQGIDAQYVYNAARNVEVATWMLATHQGRQGCPLLLSNALTDDASNLSYAREFAKIVAPGPARRGARRTLPADQRELRPGTAVHAFPAGAVSRCSRGERICRSTVSVFALPAR